MMMHHHPRAGPSPLPGFTHSQPIHHSHTSPTVSHGPHLHGPLHQAHINGHMSTTGSLARSRARVKSSAIPFFLWQPRRTTPVLMTLIQTFVFFLNVRLSGMITVTWPQSSWEFAAAPPPALRRRGGQQCQGVGGGAWNNGWE